MYIKNKNKQSLHILLIFLDPACVVIGGYIVQCVKLGENNCFEQLQPAISFLQECKDRCMAINASLSHVACVFFVWSESQVHFLLIFFSELNHIKVALFLCLQVFVSPH